MVLNVLNGLICVAVGDVTTRDVKGRQLPCGHASGQTLSTYFDLMRDIIIIQANNSKQSIETLVKVHKNDFLFLIFFETQMRYNSYLSLALLNRISYFC